jgi:transcriptional regulator with XRE-family HTH domain
VRSDPVYQLIKMTEEQRIGERVRTIRRERNLNQRQLAEKAGIAQQHLARIESGIVSATVETLSLIADALGCQLDFIKKEVELQSNQNN